MIVWGISYDQPTKFVIVAGPRTGSTHLVDYLNTIPETRCWSELFTPGRIDFRHHQPADPRLQDTEFRDAQPMAFIGLAMEEAKPCRRFGFKIVNSFKRVPEFARQISTDREWKKIYLWRDNLFEQAVSFLLAERQFGTELWERTPHEKRITISPKRLLTCLHLLQKEYLDIEVRLAAAHHDDVFGLEYHDLGRPSVVGDLRFLDVPQTVIDDVVAGAGRDRGLDFNPGPTLADRIENYAEIRAFLLNTRYRGLIEQST